jgi:hypothetical protein
MAKEEGVVDTYENPQAKDGAPLPAPSVHQRLLRPDPAPRPPTPKYIPDQPPAAYALLLGD